MSRLSQHRDDRLRREYQRNRRESTPAVSQPTRHTYEQIRAAIRTGQVSMHEQLVESQLMRSFVSTRRATRRALQMLAEDGLVDRERRVGTSVSGSIVVFDASRVLPAEKVEDEIADRPNLEDLQVAEIDCSSGPMPPFLAERLRTDETEVVAVRQLATLSGKPLYIRSGYAAQRPGYREHLEASNEHMQTMEAVFLSLFGIAYGDCEIEIHALPADPATAAMLQVEDGAPILVREMLLRDIYGQPRELSFTYFRGDLVSVVSNLVYNETIPTGS